MHASFCLRELPNFFNPFYQLINSLCLDNCISTNKLNISRDLIYMLILRVLKGNIISTLTPGLFTGLPYLTEL
jgi:hypothetical protein